MSNTSECSCDFMVLTLCHKYSDYISYQSLGPDYTNSICRMCFKWFHNRAILKCHYCQERHQYYLIDVCVCGQIACYQCYTQHKKCKLTRRAQCRDCHVKECNECWTLDDYGKLPERLRHLIYMVLLCWNRRKRDIHIPPKFVKAIILKCFVQINTPILKNFNPQPIGSGYLLDKNTGFLMTKTGS